MRSEWAARAIAGTGKLAWRNVARHRLRTAMTLAAAALGVCALILASGFVRDIYVQLGEAIIHSQTGHLQIVKTGFLGAGSRSPEKHILADVERLRRDVSALPQTAVVLARLTFTALVNNGRADLSIIGQGVEPGREAKLGTYTTILRGRALADGDRYAIVLGEGVASALKLAPGDRAALLANTYDGAANTLDVEVVGVFRTFSREFDARAVRVPLPIAQALVDSDGANTLVVALRRTSDTEAAATELRRRLAGRELDVVTWRELDDFYDKTVELYRRQFAVLEVVVLVMVLLGVANAVSMGVFERTAEFGTMRALGNSRGQVFALIVLENLIIGVAGAAAGATGGVLLGLLLSAVGIPMPPPPNANIGYTAMIRIAPLDVVAAMGIGLAATALAAIVPALRATRITVLDALRQAN
jgi:putative ABC transport system permease protein